VIIRPERVLDPQSQLIALGVPALAVATFGFSRSGGDLALVGYATGVLHALAMAVWLGGVVLLTPGGAGRSG
jgi:copper transport protein